MKKKNMYSQRSIVLSNGSSWIPYENGILEAWLPARMWLLKSISRDHTIQFNSNQYWGSTRDAKAQMGGVGRYGRERWPCRWISHEGQLRGEMR